MRKFLLPLLVVAMLVTPLTVFAQEPGSGGPVIEGNFSGSVNLGSLNPLRCGGTDCSGVAGMMFPGLIGASPFTQDYAAAGEEGVIGALATDWTVSDDGLVYTFTLRDDLTWSDGEPVTAEDVKFSFEAIASGEADTPGSGFFDYVAESNESGITEVTIVDDYTVEISFGQASCGALGRAGFSVVPAHAFGFEGDYENFDYSVMIDSEFDTAPPVAYGPFVFGNSNPGEAIGLAARTDFPEDTVIPSGYIYRDVPDQTVLVEQFLAGESTFVQNPPQARMGDIRAAEGVQPYDYAGRSWDYVGLNLADPSNPQPGLDEDGNVVDQGNHPIFGDVAVRRALQHAINVPDIVQGAVFGEGTQMASYELPTSWALNPDLEAIAYDPEAAATMLDEAGWPVGPDGVRVCDGCMYAEPGTEFSFTLITNQGNTRREAIGVIIQDQLFELGIDVDFQAIDFNTLIDQVFSSQEFDAYILGWQNGFPIDPDTTIFSPGEDNPANSGNNSVSYNNPEINRLFNEANSAAETNNCDPQARAEKYYEIQRILQEDQPYLWLFAPNQMYAATGNVEGFDPQPNLPYWDIQTWDIASAE